MNTDHLRQLLHQLDAYRVDYAIVGAVALNLHGILRATEDVDLFIQPSLKNIESLKNALRDLYSDPSVEDLDAKELIGDYPAIRYFPPEGDSEGGFYLDILTRLGERVRYEDLEILEVQTEGLTARVVSPRTLYDMKKDTVRERDRMDAYLLNEKFELE